MFLEIHPSKRLHLKIPFRVFESESNLFIPKFCNPDNQDPIFAGYGYNLQVIFIYVCLMPLPYSNSSTPPRTSPEESVTTATSVVMVKMGKVGNSLAM